VIAVFSKYQDFNPHYAPARRQPGVAADLLQFLGYYQFVDRTFPQEDEAALKESLKGAAPYVWKWSYFRTRPYLKFHLKRLFSTDEWAALRQREESYPDNHQIYQHIPADDRLEESFSREMRIPISDSFNWKEEQYGQAELIHYCFDEKALKPFVQAEEPAVVVPPPCPTGVGVEAECEDTDPKELTEKELRGTRGTVVQCLDSVLYITQAAFQRYMGHSLTSPDVLTATAQPLSDPALPLVHRMHASPCGNRAMDLSNVFLRSQWNLYRKKHNLPIAVNTRIKFDPTAKAQLADISNLLFWATLLRMTGRVQRFSIYQRFMEEIREHRVGQLPELGTREIEFFTSFVKAEIGPNNSSMSSWISGQHKNQIPNQLRSDVATFIHFVKELANNVQAKMNGGLFDSSSPQPMSRNELLSHINVIIRNSVAVDAPDVAFVAQAVLLDLEELYSDLVPVPSLTDEPDMVSGPGSDMGFLILKNAGEAETRGDAVQRLLSEMNSKAPEYLQCFGAKKNNDEDFARWSINNRPLNIFDMEHFLCKVGTLHDSPPTPNLWSPLPSYNNFPLPSPFSILQVYISVSHTFGSYCFSRQPKAAKPHCWPVRVPLESLDGHEHCTQIVSHAIAMFKQTEPSGAFFTIPDFCLLSGEKLHRLGAPTDPPNSDSETSTPPTEPGLTSLIDPAVADSPSDCSPPDHNAGDDVFFDDNSSSLHNNPECQCSPSDDMDVDPSTLTTTNAPISPSFHPQTYGLALAPLPPSQTIPVSILFPHPNDPEIYFDTCDGSHINAPMAPGPAHGPAPPYHQVYTLKQFFRDLSTNVSRLLNNHPPHP